MAVNDYLGIKTAVMTAKEYLNYQSSIFNKN